MKNRRQEQAKRVAKRLLASLTLGYGLLLLCALLFADVLADVPVTLWVQRHQNQALLVLAQLIDALGEPYVVALKALVPAAALLYYGYRREALFLAATLLADGANLIFKNLANRARPENGVVKVLEEAGNNGFPSGHTLNFIVYFGFWLVLLPVFTRLHPGQRKILSAVLVALVLLAPWARVYMGMHWPSDIIGGGLFGTVFLGMLCYAYFTAANRAKGTLAPNLHNESD